mmetsp:Transcript_5080/g.14378  ORF Transcript_5080/g.14378 Transcript_5080/m.14378 type:complete len:224 (+) Transcript_5080:1610-2281(+)
MMAMARTAHMSTSVSVLRLRCTRMQVTFSSSSKNGRHCSSPTMRQMLFVHLMSSSRMSSTLMIFSARSAPCRTACRRVFSSRMRPQIPRAHIFRLWRSSMRIISTHLFMHTWFSAILRRLSGNSQSRRKSWMQDLSSPFEPRTLSSRSASSTPSLRASSTLSSSSSRMRASMHRRLVSSSTARTIMIMSKPWMPPLAQMRGRFSSTRPRLYMHCAQSRWQRSL